MTDTYVWSELRDRIIDTCADAPHAEQEQRILDVFIERPALVTEAVDHVLTGYARGTVRSVWPVLVKHVEELAVTEQRASLPIEDTSTKRKRVQRAEQWMRTAGTHFDRESEILDELFGGRGMLRAYASYDYEHDELSGDVELVERMTTLWQSERLTGIKIEQESLERAAKYVAGRRQTKLDTHGRGDGHLPHETSPTPGDVTVASPALDAEIVVNGETVGYGLDGMLAAGRALLGDDRPALSNPFLDDE